MDLAADVEMQACIFYRRQLLCAANGRQQIFGRKAEFVLAKAGGDFGMGVRIDIRVYAECHTGCNALFCGEFADVFEFGAALHVET